MKYLCIILIVFGVANSNAQIITTIGGMGAWKCSGDGGPATSADIGQLYGTAVDASGNVYISSISCNKVRKISPAGIITTVAGNGTGGSSGDGGQATDASLQWPSGLAVDKSGNLYIADWISSVIRKVTPSGIITTIAGNAAVGAGYSGDGGLAAHALISWPTGIALDTAGNIFISEEGNNVIRRISKSGIISRVGGSGLWGYTGDGGPALLAGIQAPFGVAVDNPGNIYVVDADNHVIRKISTTGIITTIAGNGTIGYSGDGGPATAAQLAFPESVIADNHGNIYIAESRNNVIRKVDAYGIISTFAGNGIAGHSGDGGVCTHAQMSSPYGIAIDGNGYFYISELNGACVRKVDTCIVPFIAPFTGDSLLCLGMTTLLSDSVHGGVWSISNSAVASIDTSGFVNSISRGIASISYSITNHCATVHVSKEIIVGPYAGVISGPWPHTPGTPDSFCYAAMLTTDGSPGGVWGLTDTTKARYSSPGMLYSLAINSVDTAFYAITDSCGSDTSYFSFVFVVCPDDVKAQPGEVQQTTVYPIPTNGELNIASTKKITDISISTLPGQIIYSGYFNSEQVKINMADFPAGIYLLTINKLEIKKIVKM